jgi:hypothetical protein
MVRHHLGPIISVLSGLLVIPLYRCLSVIF